MFVIGKTRNAPLKQWSIPRLDLQAAAVSTRLHLMIMDELDLSINSATFWTDSMTVLQYVTNEKRRFKPFTEIHEASSPEQWRHVPTSLNPADDGSRGTDIHALKTKCRWLFGPKFLVLPEDQWPVKKIGKIPDDDKEVEVEKHVTFIMRGSGLDQLLRRYSSWLKLQTLVAWLMRFMAYIANKNGPLKSARISIPQMRKSTEEIVQMVQRQYFSEEIDCLTDGRQVKGHSKLSKLSPVLIEGRIRHAPIPFDAIHLMILPRDHPVSTFIVSHYHEYLGHAGRAHILTTLRQRFWLLQPRTLVRQVLQKCVSCRKRKEAPMQQLMADLPKERLIPFQPPSTYTGEDFFGPFHVKRGRSTEKVYGCLFTCFTSRAVYIEHVSSLETDSFIQDLRRFISNRGHRKEIWSYNATNFAGAEKEIQQSLRDWNQDELNKHLRKDEISCYLCPRIEWKFQLPTTSHMSGICERLIRSVRKMMKAVLGDPNTFVGLETLRKSSPKLSLS